MTIQAHSSFSPHSKPAGRSPGSDGGREDVRVLIAEDNEIGLEFACLMARRLGIAAEGATDGQHALLMVEQAAQAERPYALVLMDFMMPVVDGIEATRRLRRAGFTETELPIVALTAIAEPRAIARFDDAGGQGYLSKPLTLEKLSAVLEAWLPPGSGFKSDEHMRHSADLRRRYLSRKHATFDLIDSAIDAGEADPATLLTIRDLLHKLAGTAGMFGDEALSEAASSCEVALGGVCGAGAIAILLDHRPQLGPMV